MNRKQLRSELAFLLVVIEGDSDQDFATLRLNKLIDRAYNLEVERAKTAAVKDYFKGFTDDFTWTAAEDTLTVPDSLIGVSILTVMDITNGEPGIPLTFSRSGQGGGDIFWKDRETWQWSTVGGPSADLTLRGIYEQIAVDLQDDEAEPTLVPSQFHWMLVWSAAILGRSGADDMVPQDWRAELRDMRLDFHKHVSKGRPQSLTPMTRQSDEDATGFLF